MNRNKYGLPIEFKQVHQNFIINSIRYKYKDYSYVSMYLRVKHLDPYLTSFDMMYYSMIIQHE